MIFGVAVHPRHQTRSPTFLLKDFAFKVSRNSGTQPGGSARPDPNTLDYLGVFVDGKEMPAEGNALNNARGRLNSWLHSDRIDGESALVSGVMAIRSAAVIKRVRDGLKDALDAEFATMSKANTARREQGEVRHPETELPHPEADLLRCATVSDENGKIVIISEDKFNEFKWKTDKVTFKLVKQLSLTLTPVAGAGYRIDGKLRVHLQ